MNINKLKSSSPYLNKTFEFIKTNVENTLRGKKLIDTYSIQIKKLKVTRKYEKPCVHFCSLIKHLKNTFKNSITTSVFQIKNKLGHVYIFYSSRVLKYYCNRMFFTTRFRRIVTD